MTRWILLAVALIGTTWFLRFEGPPAGRLDTGDEQWINANLLRVRVDGTWREVPMVALGDHLCRSRHPQFRRYCDPLP